MSIQKSTIPHPDETGVTLSLVPGAGIAVPFEIRESVNPAAAAANVTLTQKVPAKSVIQGYYIECTEVAAIATGTHIALGSAGDLDLVIDDLAKGDYDAIGDSATGAINVAFNAETALLLSPTNGSGVAAGSFTTGAWSIVLWGVTLKNLED